MDEILVVCCCCPKVRVEDAWRNPVGDERSSAEAALRASHTYCPACMSLARAGYECHPGYGFVRRDVVRELAAEGWEYDRTSGAWVRRAA